MFQLVTPHLKKLGLLLGLLDFQDGKAVYEMPQQKHLGPVAC